MSAESHNLPGILGEIADLVGIEAALAVAAKVGGTRAYITRKPDANHWLVRAIGPEKAAVLVEHYTTGRTGAELEFPIGPGGSYNREKRQRAARMRELAEQGLQSTAIARQVGVTRRSAMRFLKRQREVDEGDPDAPKFPF